MTENLQERIIRHEGMRNFPYKDHLGFLTIGIGRCIEKSGISESEALLMLNNDIQKYTLAVMDALPWTYNLDEARFGVLVEMAFQMGIDGLLKFKNTLSAIENGNYERAAQGMINSLWHKQTPKRCEELAEIMRKG